MIVKEPSGPTTQASEKPGVHLDAHLLAHILDDSLNEIYMFDESSLHFLQVNYGGRKNLGYTMDELRAMTPLSIKPDFTSEEFDSHIQPLRAGTEKHVVFYTHHQRKDGTRYPVEVHLQLAKQGPEPVFVAIILDITDRIRLQDQFLHAQKMESVGRLTGGLAHDLNNLLAGVMTGCRLVARKLGRKDIEGALAVADEVEDSIQRGTEMTRHLLDFSRTGRSPQRQISPNDVLDSAEPMLRRLLGEDVTVKISRLASGHFVTDPGRLEQIVMNLCINARDAMPNGGSIMIETADVQIPVSEAGADAPEDPVSHVVVEVRDTGCGMTPDVQAKAREPYFTTKDAGQGTGLGLSTVSQIVAEAGGFVEIESELNVGTSVRLFFPRCESDEPKSAEETVPAAVNGSGETILLVEDETLLRAVMKELLVELGYQPLTAADPELALELVREHDGGIDLIVTDVVLPGQGSAEMVSELCQTDPEARVLYMSGFSEEYLVGKGKLEPGSHFLEKPFSEEVLARTVRRSLDDIATRSTT